MIRGNPRLLALVALSATLGACSDGVAGEAASPSATARDSSGIRIVEHAEGAAPPRWRIGSEPVLHLGWDELSPDGQLFQVVGAVPLPDGGMLVANAGTHEIRRYDASGAVTARHGGKGQGPGEFEAIGWMGIAGGDTVAVWDPSLKRLTRVSADGGIVESVSLPGIEGFSPRMVGVMRDGSAVVAEGYRIHGFMSGPSGVRRDTAEFHRFGPDGERIGSVARVPGEELYVRHREGGFAWNAVPFGRTVLAAVHEDRFYLGSTDAYEVRVLGPDGAVERIVRGPWDGARVRPAEIDQYRAERLGRIGNPAQRADVEATLRDAPYPQHYPAFQRLVVAGDGRLWVRDYPPPGEETVSWRVFDARGDLLAEVRLPTRYEVMSVSGRTLVARWLDDLDVEHVGRFTIHEG